LATSTSLIVDSDEDEALYDLTTVLGPLPKEWTDSIGTELRLQNVHSFHWVLGTSYSSSTRDTSLQEILQLMSKVDDTPGLIALLEQILVFDPLRRPEVLDFLHHPWFTERLMPFNLDHDYDKPVFTSSCSLFDGMKTSSSFRPELCV